MSCTQKNQEGHTMSPEEHENMQEDHMGCADNEISEDGKCVPAEASKNNMSLFDEDVESFVVWKDVVEWELRGFYVEPKEAWDYPGIVMIHEWWGLNENIKYMAKLLSKQGYRVFAIDLYNGEVAADSDVAKKLSGEVRANPEKATEKMQSAVTYLKDVWGSSKIASLGWCFWGQQSLNISLAQELDATVIYYGHLTDDAQQLKKLKWPVLGIFGAKDTGIPVESVNAFKSQLDSLEKKNSITIYPEVGHAFANPSGQNYSAQETKDAWEKTVTFLKETLQ